MKVLYLSARFWGLAPYKHVNDVATTSYFDNTWSLMMLLAVTLVGISAFIFEPIDTLYVEAGSNFVVEIVDTLEAYVSSLAMIGCLIFALLNRKKLIRALNDLRLIDAELKSISGTSTEDKYITFKISIALAVLYSYIIVINSLERVVFTNEGLLQVLLYGSPAIFTGHFVLMFCFNFLRVRHRFMELNRIYEGNRGTVNDGEKGKKFAPKDLEDPKKYIYKNLQKEAETVRRLHFKLCDVSSDINSAFTPQILCVLVQSLITFISMVFYLTSKIIDNSTEVNTLMYFYTFLICGLSLMQVIGIVIPSVIVSGEAQKTASIMFRKEFHLLRFKEFEHEIFFSAQLIHQKVQICVCQGLPITGSMLTSILGLMTTYLLIVIQFDVSLEALKASP